MQARSTNKMRHVGLCLPTSVGFFASVIRGAYAFAQEDRRWVFQIWANVQVARTSLAEARPDGVILDAYDRTFVKRLKAVGVAMVTVTDQPEVPFVGVDDLAIGQLAAEHFLARGFQHFAFCGYPLLSFSTTRQESFVQALKGRGLKVDIFTTRHPYEAGVAAQERMGRWVQTLPKPVAILTCHDRLGLELTHGCWHMGIRVPEEAAILGVDNNELECGLSHPPLSSVSIAAERVGFEAAVMLDSLMNGKPPKQNPLLIRPIQVITRQSTDILAIDDPDVAAAVHFIRNNAGEPIDVENVLQQVPVSRRSLERRFRALLGRSPRQEIRRMHLERAKELLMTTTLPTSEVALRSGLPDAAKLSLLFRKEFGETPTEFRRTWRRGVLTT